MQDIGIFGTLIIVIIGYLIGSISPSIIIGRTKFDTDVREHHSKNAGATNSTRVLGKKWGFLILMLDGVKPMVAILVAYGFTYIKEGTNWEGLFTQSYIYAAGLAAIVGHCWPIFFGFRGGKGAASSLGFLLFINPIYFVVAVATWWILLYFFKMVSLSSIFMMSIVFIISWIPGIPITAWLWPHDKGVAISIFILIAWVIVVIQHRSNIIRIIRKEERKVTIFDRFNHSNKCG